MYLYIKYDLGSLLNYNKLVDNEFNYKTDVTSEDWAAMFQQKLGRVTVDSNASGHMATLLSKRGEGLNGEITKEFACTTC